MFGLRTFQGCVDREVGVKETLDKMVLVIVGIQSLTLKCLARVLSLKSFLEKLLVLTIFIGNEGLYSIGKGM